MVISAPAYEPSATFSFPGLPLVPVKLARALYPIPTLKQVFASEDAPAPVPAYKFSCPSGENPPADIPVRFDQSP